jgi:hypothetical protein
VYEICFLVVSPVHFKATLVWTDPPASLVSQHALVNDLDLVVEDPLRRVWLGNHPTEPLGMGTKPDSLNNIEQVFHEQAIVGNYKLRVSGTNVPQGPQDFALVVTADFMPAECSAAVFADPNNIVGKADPAPVSTPLPTQLPVQLVCEDTEAMCTEWAARGICDWERYTSYMHKFCRRACNVCSEAPSTAAPTSDGAGEECTNLENDFLCSYWKSFDYCTDKFETFMATYCRKTCQMCTEVGYNSEGYKSSTPVKMHELSAAGAIPPLPMDLVERTSPAASDSTAPSGVAAIAGGVVGLVAAALLGIAVMAHRRQRGSVPSGTVGLASSNKSDASLRVQAVMVQPRRILPPDELMGAAMDESGSEFIPTPIRITDYVAEYNRKVNALGYSGAASGRDRSNESL